MFIHLNKKGQGTLEYAVIIAVIVAALIAMQTYMKRGMQGKLRESSDNMGEQFSAQHMTGTAITDLMSVPQTQEIVNTDGTSTLRTLTPSIYHKTGTENVGALDQEYWPQ